MSSNFIWSRDMLQSTQGAAHRQPPHQARFAGHCSCGFQRCHCNHHSPETCRWCLAGHCEIQNQEQARQAEKGKTANSEVQPPTKQETFAKRRLLKDLKELQAEAGSSLSTITALPTDNIFEWHCNLRPDEGPFAGTVFHLILNFPKNYPHAPPEVCLCTSISHPNVFEGWRGDGYPYICLDMLKEHSTGDLYAGWTSAYSVMSLLLQLQSFLFAENIPQEYGGTASSNTNWRSVLKAAGQAQEFSCTFNSPDGDRVTHTHDKPWPPLPSAYTGEKPSFGVLQAPCDSGAGYGVVQTLSTGEQYRTVGSVGGSKVRIARSIQNQMQRQRQAQFVMKSAEFPDLNGGLMMLTAAELDDDDHCSVTSEVASEGSADTHVPEPEVAKEVESVAVAIPTDLLVHTFSFLHQTELLRVRDVCKQFRQVVISYNLFERPQLRCFHSKKGLEDEGTILGVGLNVNFHNDGNLKDASSPLDILSYESFSEEGVQHSVWGGASKIAHFLPLIISEAHAGTAMLQIRRCVYGIMKRVPLPNANSAIRLRQGRFSRNTRNSTLHHSFHPLMVLQLLSSLMNHMAVQLMASAHEQEQPQRNTNTNNNNSRLRQLGFSSRNQGGGSSSTTTVRRYASEKALEGYCAFHHILLHFATQYPAIRTEANRQIDSFIASEKARTKEQTPNLGSLLVCLTLSGKGWCDLWRPLVLECFDRNVRWVLQKHPELSRNKHTPQVDEDQMLCKTFLGSLTSKRLLMFQVHFMAHIGRPAGVAGPREVLARYEKRLGRPTTIQKEGLQAACKEILAVESWTAFFERIRVPVPTKEKLVTMLDDAVANSRRKRYHR